MTIPVPSPSDVARPINRVERRKASRRPCRFERAVLRIAEECGTVGPAVILLDLGGARLQRNQFGKHGVTTDADRIRAWWRRWLTASIGLRLLRVVCRTRRGQAT